MNWQTEKKVNDIKELLAQGNTKRDILEKKFQRSKKGLLEHIEKAKELYTEQELELLSENHSTILVKAQNKALTAPKNSDTLQLSSEKRSQLELILNNAEKLVEFINSDKFDTNREEIEEAQISHELKISDYIIKSKNKIKSIRISESILEEFNQLCDDNPLYSKTNHLNQALREYIDKYRK